ncbi:GxxExxY protein [Adhaeretor mobilis]
MVDAAITVHRELGPGLLKSVYEVVLHHELKSRGIKRNQEHAAGAHCY